MFQTFKSKIKFVVTPQAQSRTVHMYAVSQKIQGFGSGFPLRKLEIFRGQTNDLGKGQSFSMQHVVQHQAISVGESELVETMIQ